MTEQPSTDLVRRPHALATRPGTSGDTSTLVFDARPLVWGDVPAALRRAARHDAPVVADRAVADPVVYRDDEHGLVEVMRAWRAHRDRLYVALALRPVRSEGEQVRPTGPWQPVGLRRYDAAGEVRRRVGQVPAGLPPAAPRGAAGVPAGAARPVRPSVDPEHASAADAWTYLPQPVRTSAERAVPVPDDWIGDLQQRQVRGLPRSQEVVVLRRDGDRALVVRASREVVPARGVTEEEQSAALARADWTVEQVVLPTARPRLLEATREVPTWI